ncbi:unnamed protein product [Symbiodinium natans]|uniref:DDE-1 domain-containing protein n=1 Tax=Symbiodinium natans TaxID=878477 RepID=A0A812IGE9_9DINO|nr:unnamed protein product [Symbiodinium natans]
MEYVVQHRLRSWVEHLNCDKGVAPSRAMLTAHAGQCIPDIVPAEIRQRLERQLHGPARGQRKWLSRFRRRWKCRVGALPALAYWQWLGFARLEAVTAGQEPLIVNVDETSISFVTGLKGTVIKACKGKRAREAASLSQRRSNFTYLAAITPDPAIQPFLPQFVLLNEHQISKEELAAAVRSAPPNVRMLRRPSAWCDNAVMRQYLSALRASLQTAAPDRYAILLLDVARAHVHNSIRDHAKRCRVRLVYVPAGTTKYLQPCDLQLFHSFKRVLEEVWRERKGHAVIGALTMQFRLGVLFEAMKRVLATRKWEKAFQLAGVLGDQRSIKRSLLDVLGWTQVPEIPVRPPSLADAARIFPRRMKIDTMSYIYWHKDRPLPDEARRNLPCLD